MNPLWLILIVPFTIALTVLVMLLMIEKAVHDVLRRK